MTGIQALVFLAAAVVCVPLARKAGMSSVLGYLFAGVVIGPFVLGFVGEEGQDIMHFAEFGVVMMLFLVGLELEPEAFWRMRSTIVGVGTSQLIGSAVLFAGIALLLGLDWRAALAIGPALAMSSTAIALQSLKEKGEMGTPAGQHSFAVLLYQDIAVIPILALLPLIALAPAKGGGSHGRLEELPGGLRTLAVIAAVAVVVLAGRYVVVPLLRVVARTHLRELFTASALLIVVAIAYLMQYVGLSPALGTFLAGLVLATSEFKHELESDLDPFKGLLLGLFFMAVGASIDFRLVMEQPVLVAALTVGVVALKFGVLFAIGLVRKLEPSQNFTFAIGLSQVGEFAFVLFAFIAQLGILDGRVMATLMAVTALSMASTPFLTLAHDKLLRHRIERQRGAHREADTVEEKNRVIIAGFSHFGSTIGRFLRAHGVDATILDHDSDTVDLLRKMGFKVYYGDATRIDLLESAGARDAEILISAVDGPHISEALVRTVKKHFPHLRVFVRAKNRFDAWELMEFGDDVKIYREHLDTSIRVGVDVLEMLGHRSYTAYRAGQQFLKWDEAALVELAATRHDAKLHISRAREQIEIQEQLLMADRQHDPSAGDHAWDSEELRGGRRKDENAVPA
ncbi:MAG: monovalent cation:proton antiporter-2 (CPA2) family protein [Thermoanaerobaculia bacterium]